MTDKSPATGDGRIAHLMMPVFTAVFAIPLLGESIDVYHVVGAVLIVVGVTLAGRNGRRAI